MISFYDALSFSVQKRSLFAAFCAAFIMLFFLILTGVSIQNNYALFSLFKTWLLSPSDSTMSYGALAQMAYVLSDLSFWGFVFRRGLWVAFWFFFFGLSFFALQVVIAKKALFNQPPRFTASFFIVTLAKLMLLLSPVLFVSYVLFGEVFKAGFTFVAAVITSGNPTYDVSFFDKNCILMVSVAFVYFLLVMVLFIERFSFASLLNVKPFFMHLKTIGELILKIILNNLVLATGLFVLCFLCWQFNALYVCFFSLMAYLIYMLVSSARGVLTLPFVVVGIAAGYLGWALGYEFFHNYLFTFLLFFLVYFCFFFLWFVFWSTLGYLFASAAFVLRFNKTPAKDAKKQSPEKLRRIDDLYKNYLTEHKNDTQDNFFHHL